MIAFCGRTGRAIGALAFGALVFIWIPGTTYAQAGTAAKSTITIDGSVEPERIPAWIAWRELFNMALIMDDKHPDSGQEFWARRLGLSPGQIHQLLAHARSLREDEKEIDQQAKNLKLAKQGKPDGALKIRLHELEADKQSRVLERRDSLKGQIGTEAVLRLQSFITINIAPNIKVGAIVPDGK